MLSKSRILASLQCLKRVHLEVNRPELKRYSKQAEAAFAVGHEVGALARRLYDDGDGTLVEYDGIGFAPALALTDALLASPFPAPVFEATLKYDNVLVREDVLLPVEVDGERSWRVVEVKSATSVKPEYRPDCAVQAWVHREAGYPLAGIALAHVNNGFVYPGDGDYDGLLREQDLTAEVLPLLPEVPHWVRRARDAVEGPLPDVPVGGHCTQPYDCPFLHVCWPGDTDYPVQSLGGSRKKLGVLVMNGCRDVRDVPASALDGEQQQRIHRITCAGEPELLPGARAFAESLPYPRFYLDFETVAPAIPLWPGTRPYQALPFQWSCHVERAPGALEHREFLDLGGAPPLRPVTEALIDALERDGPVLVYTSFEAQALRRLAAHLPDLDGPLHAIVDRLVDLYPVTKRHYYHPDMRGSWSIKAVLPTIAPDLDYAALDGVAEGTEASAAYLEAINPATPPARRDAIRAQLLRYCRQDTEAMVRLVHFFAEQA